MIELHAELRQRGFKTYISQHKRPRHRAHPPEFSFFQNFDGYIFSYEVKAMKPTRQSTMRLNA